ncbi:MAG: hypothetical protein PUA59_08955 [Clostridium sp.]|nr:hypothetical protein [Clostridium sp.]
MKVEDIIKTMAEVAEAFYQNRNDAGNKMMPEIVRQLTEMWNEMSSEQDQKRLYQAVQNLMQAYEQKSYVLVADILTFDIKTLLTGN